MSSKYTFRISNYRCFPRETPIEFSIGDGITAFVGRNNAGKSALLRFLHEIRPLIPAFNNTPFPDGQYSAVSFQPPIRDPKEILCNLNKGDCAFEFVLPMTTPSAFEKDSQTLEVQIRRSDANMRIAKLNGCDWRPFHQLKPESGIFYTGPSRTAIADATALASSLKWLSNAMYIPAFRTMGGGGFQSYDMMVGLAFVATWVNAKDGNDLVQREVLLRVEDDVARLLGFRRFETRKASASDSLLVRIDHADYHLADVGAGVAQLLMLLGTVALKQPTFLFIDEPELNLHPSLQIDLVSTLAEYVKGNLVFATHNIGLARATATRIYAVNQVAAGHSTVHPLEDSPTLAQLLGELQYGAYSQVGGNRVLLVEGSDDVLVFQQFLRKLGMDHQVIVLPLGGATMINGGRDVHLEEVKRICPNVAAIIDSESTTAGAPLSRPRQAFKESCAKLGFECHVTKRRATEHYFPQRALQIAFGSGAQELQPFADIKLGGNWSKSTNWLAAAEMTKDELLATDVGEFLRHWCSTKAGPNR